MNVQFFGHSFFRVSFGKTNILLDPFIKSVHSDEGYKRLVKCPVGLEKLKKVDAIFVSNEGFDHFDRETVKFLALRDNCAVISHESVLSELEIPHHLKKNVSVNDSFSIRGIDFEVLPAHCPGCFYPLGATMKKGGESLFFAGDTTLTENFGGIKANVALLPIGGSITMDVIDAVKATKSMKPDYVIPMHYNTFHMIKADPHDFRTRIEKSILKTKPVVLNPGQTFRT